MRKTVREAIRSLLLTVTLAVFAAFASLVGPSTTEAEVNDSPPSLPPAANTFEVSHPPSSWEISEGETAGAGLRLDLALRAPEGGTPAEEEEFIEEYDPWEPFNEVMFSLNLKLDRYVVKPVAKVWNGVLPDPVKRSLDRAFDNLGMPTRLVNNVFQLKLTGAGRELVRFLVNSTIGVAGLFDVAKSMGIEEADEDAGQTLALYGVGPGPYLILPLFPPLTVRDGIGTVIDGVLDPLNYFFPAEALTGMEVGDRVNDRALNLELFEAVEETAIDLYSAVRNGYLQRRQQVIRE
ncbi:MAG: VacJ family lipoprotein [Candidatus Methylomirabilia bacterium]